MRYSFLFKFFITLCALNRVALLLKASIGSFLTFLYLELVPVSSELMPSSFGNYAPNFSAKTERLGVQRRCCLALIRLALALSWHRRKVSCRPLFAYEGQCASNTSQLPVDHASSVTRHLTTVRAMGGGLKRAAMRKAVVRWAKHGWNSPPEAESYIGPVLPPFSLSPFGGACSRRGDKLCLAGDEGWALSPSDFVPLVYFRSYRCCACFVGFQASIREGLL